MKISLLQRLRQHLTFRIGSIFFLLLLVSTLSGVLAIRYFVKNDLESETRKEMIHMVNRLESDLSRLRDEVSLLAQLSARSSQVVDRKAQQGAKTLQITVLEESRLHGIEINEFVSGHTDTPNIEVLRRGFAGMRTVDYIVWGEGPGKLHIMGVSPVETGGTERKVISASMSLGREFLRKQKESLGGDVSILTREGLVASSSQCIECLECLKEILSREDEWRDIESGKMLYYTFDCNPEPQGAIVYPIRTFGGQTVAMAVFRSRANEINALQHTTMGVVGGGVAFSLAMGVAFFLLISRVIHPLRELTRLTTGISSGHYGETVPVRGQDEVGELALAFNRMSISLKQAVEEISEWNQTLEVRVVEKTTELEKVHGRMVEVEKLAAIGQLAAGVAHELNNPLSGIMGSAEVALELFNNRPPGDMTPRDMEKMIGYFRQIEALSQRCRGIIVDMLTFARQHREEPTDIHLNDVIRSTLTFLDKQLSKGRVTVKTEFEDGLPIVVGNSLQLQQVFTNLILNAVQAMRGGGEITIRTMMSGKAVRADVVDNGTGIAPENRSRIFEPFFTTKPTGEGTGLGLSVSYGIVQRHGGDIVVESEPGRGSVFSVVLPVADTP